jgi:hypothetical protein
MGSASERGWQSQILTYMSIRDLILNAVRLGMLFPLIPQAPGTSAKRALLVYERLWEILRSPEGTDEWEKRVAELQADLELFAEGTPVHPKYLFHLYPLRDAVWEIRSTRESPSIRVLGFFAEKDVFIATNVALREELGGWQSREWRTVKRQAGARWRHIFHTYPPMKGSDIHTLVSGAIDGTYFRSSGP